MGIVAAVVLVGFAAVVLSVGSAEPGALAYGVDGDIYVAEPDGSNPVRIADGVPVDDADDCGQGERRARYIAFGTAWSPDGRYLAYWNRGCPEPANASGTATISEPGADVVAFFPGEGRTISWSPDSTRVAIWDPWSPEESDGARTIGVYGLDGVRQGALRVPAQMMPSGNVSPVWSRDGTSLLLPGVQMPLDGRPPQELPADGLTPGRWWGAVYSPDGSRVADVDNGSVVVADADAPDAQAPAGATEFSDAAWSSSGDRIAFIHDETVVLDDRSRTELRVTDVAPEPRGRWRTRAGRSGSKSSSSCPMTIESCSRGEAAVPA